MMAIYRAKDIRSMGLEELEEKKQQLMLELSKEKSAVASGTKPDNAGKIREMKRTIARINTIKKERGASN